MLYATIFSLTCVRVKVAYLLIFGGLPTHTQLDQWSQKVKIIQTSHLTRGWNGDAKFKRQYTLENFCMRKTQKGVCRELSSNVFGLCLFQVMTHTYLHENMVQLMKNFRYDAHPMVCREILHTICAVHASVLYLLCAYILHIICICKYIS